MTDIKTYAFSGCWRLTQLVFPAGLASIGANAFADTGNSTYGGRLKIFDFRLSSAIPTLANTNAFSMTVANKEIIVPDELYEDWIAADNWKSSTNGIVDSIVKASESSLGPLQTA